jgi:hypothetical protein
MDEGCDLSHLNIFKAGQSKYCLGALRIENQFVSEVAISIV